MDYLMNKIIIIGADHHNTLAAIRCFGSMGCRIEVLFTSAQKINLNQIKCAHSKYCKYKCFIVGREEKAIVEWLVKHGKENKEKAILFPCTDFVAYTIDLYQNELENNYIFPRIKDKPGRMAFLMNKWNQHLFAKQHCFPMAKTWICLLENTRPLPEDIVYPCIAKPNLSAHGNKSDIRVCNTCDELAATLQVFKMKGYTDILIQQFIKKDYEVCAFGCLVEVGNRNDITNDEAILQRANYGCYIKKQREYPSSGGGSTTYAVTIQDTKIESILDKILIELYSEGYRGDYDIELLVLDGMVYLNEINFRQSANIFALCKFGIPAPYINCIGLIGMSESLHFSHKPEAGLHLINELSDKEHIKSHEVDFLTWVLDFIRSKAYAVFSLRDLPGTFAFYKPMIKSIPLKVKNLFRK